MDNLRTVLDSLNDRELDYVVARSKTTSTSQALKDAGFSRGWFYSLSDERKEHLDDAALKLKRESAIKATMILQDAVELAAQVKVDGLNSRKDHVKQSAATEILDRQLGKPTQKQEITSETDGTITINVIHDKED